MRIKRTLPLFLAVIVIAAAITLAVQLRKNAPPEAARLLPGADAFVYADLSWVRKASAGKPLVPVGRDPDYDRFVQETGFDFEHDLDAAAFAIHYPSSWPGGGTAGAAPEPRFSEVFTAKFDGSKCLAYLQHSASSVENYDSIDIFTIPIQGRTFRVAILNVDTVAASNLEDPAVIHGMVDRARRLASPFGGPALLRRYFKRVQLASPFWLIGRIPPRIGIEPWSDIFSKPAELVVSASYNPLHLPLRSGALHLRAEAWAGSKEEASAIADKANVFLTMFRSAEVSVGAPGSDADLKTFFDSLQVRQEDSHAELSATVPGGIFHKLLESPPQESPQPVPVPAQKSR